MKPSTVKTLLILWILVILMPLWAAPSKLESKTSIDVNAAAPRDVYASLSRTLGCNLVIAPEVQQAVTMHLENVTVRTALTALSETLDCQWKIEGDTLHVAPAGAEKVRVTKIPISTKERAAGDDPHKSTLRMSVGVTEGASADSAKKIDFKQKLERKTPANFRFENVALGTVMDAIGKIADFEIQVEEPMAKQNVTLDLSDQTLISAFKAIQQQVGSAKGLIFTITVPGEGHKLMLKMGPSLLKAKH